MEFCKNENCSINNGNKMCKECRLEKARIYARNYRKLNKEKVKQSNTEYIEKNRDKVKEWNRNHFLNNKDRVRERARKNYTKYRENPNIRIIQNTRTRLGKLLKNINKGATSEELLGCNGQFLKDWLEYSFNSEMTWDNYGRHWHIDHVIPCNSFDLTNNNELKNVLIGKI